MTPTRKQPSKNAQLEKALEELQQYMDDYGIEIIEESDDPEDFMEDLPPEQH